MKSISEREDTSKKVYDSSVAPKLSSRDGFLCYKYVKIIYNYIFKDILTNFADCVEYRVQFHKKHGNNIDNNHLIISKPGEPVIPTERSDKESLKWSTTRYLPYGRYDMNYGIRHRGYCYQRN